MEKPHLKVFISAYACEPGLGSEIGVGWHWVLEMSKYFELWVLTRKSNQKNIEEFFNNYQIQNEIHFLYFDLPKWLRFWKKGLRGVRIYYMIWQRLSESIIKKTMEKNQIDIYHLLTYGNALWPVSQYGQKKFFVWGPTSIADSISYEFSKHYSFKWKIVESVRSIISMMLPYNPGFRKKCKNANLILCKTKGTLNSIPFKYRNKAIFFTDVAVEELNPSSFSKSIEENTYIKYLAVGRLEAWRGFDLLIEAFSIALKSNRNIRLEILGHGSDHSRLTKIIDNLKVHDHISLPGKVSKELYYIKMAQADVIVNPCLREGAVTVSFDSISFRKPIICIETGGYTNYFSNDYASVISRSSRIRIIEDLHKAIIEMADSDIRKLKSKKISEVASDFTWEKKGEQIHKVISVSFNNYNYSGLIG